MFAIRSFAGQFAACVRAFSCISCTQSDGTIALETKDNMEITDEFLVPFA
jgi:hypothetical protein